jgi:hypothetical protein
MAPRERRLEGILAVTEISTRYRGWVGGAVEMQRGLEIERESNGESDREQESKRERERERERRNKYRRTRGGRRFKHSI